MTAQSVEDWVALNTVPGPLGLGARKGASELAGTLPALRSRFEPAV